MYGRSNAGTAAVTNEPGNGTVEIATERFERWLAEECGKLRVEVANGFGDIRSQIAGVRAEMIDRNGELLKWALVFWATQIAAVAGLLALFR